MAFERSFDTAKILANKNKALYERLWRDVKDGDVFPAVRKGELDFYYVGGVLFSFGSSFKRDRAYLKYSGGSKDADGYATEDTFLKQGLIEGGFLDNYDRFKGENQKKFSDGGEPKERQFLGQLYKYTFAASEVGRSKAVVLDIEVRLNVDGSGKKCDMVLFNTETQQLMFVEGKNFSDSRMKCALDANRGSCPEVVKQIKSYNSLISKTENLSAEYAKQIGIVNALFGTNYNTNITCLPEAKLLVYNTPTAPTANQSYSIDVIKEKLGAHNVLFHYAGETDPTLDEIWRRLTLA
jgi:hypothetical protein